MNRFATDTIWFDGPDWAWIPYYKIDYNEHYLKDMTMTMTMK